MPREFLERMTVVEVPAADGREAASLEALFHSPMQPLALDEDDEEPAPALLLPGIPAIGGTMDHAVMAEVAWAISQLGAATLRINFEGVGASSKTNPQPLWLDFSDVTDDALALRLEAAVVGAGAALEQLRETIAKTPAVVVGHGFGALVAAKLAASSGDVVKRAVLIAPPMTLSAWDPVTLTELDADIDLLLPATDDRSPPLKREEAKDAGLWPAVIEEADANFVRGLSALGQQVVQRAYGRLR